MVQLRKMIYVESFIIQELNPCRKLTLHKPEATRRAGRPAVTCLDSVEEDMKAMGFRHWKRKSQDLDQWRAIVKEQSSSWTVTPVEEEKD
jgi:hypothetical protein